MGVGLVGCVADSEMGVGLVGWVAGSEMGVGIDVEIAKVRMLVFLHGWRHYHLPLRHS